MTNKSEYIANKIKQLRDTVSWSQSELARQAGVTSAAISKIEKGGRIPSMMVTRKIADAFKISVNELTGDSPSLSNGINDEAQAFFRKFGDIQKLSEQDQKLILGIAKSMSEKDVD